MKVFLLITFLSNTPAKVSDGSFRFSFTEELDPFKACIAYLNDEGVMSMIYFMSDDPDYSKVLPI